MTADFAAIRARWAAVQDEWIDGGDRSRWSAHDVPRMCPLSSATLTAVLHAPDDVRTLLHEARVLREQRDLASQQPVPVYDVGWAELENAP